MSRKENKDFTLEELAEIQRLIIIRMESFQIEQRKSNEKANEIMDKTVDCLNSLMEKTLGKSELKIEDFKIEASNFYPIPKVLEKVYIVISSECDDHEIVKVYKKEDDAKNKVSENENFEYYEYEVE